MAKAVKDHRTKKNSHMHEEWKKRKAAANASNKSHLWFQGEWRRKAIIDRTGTERFTAKNQKEADKLGITFVLKMTPQVV